MHGAHAPENCYACSNGVGINRWSGISYMQGGFAHTPLPHTEDIPVLKYPSLTDQTLLTARTSGTEYSEYLAPEMDKKTRARRGRRKPIYFLIELSLFHNRHLKKMNIERNSNVAERHKTLVRHRLHRKSVPWKKTKVSACRIVLELIGRKNR